MKVAGKASKTKVKMKLNFMVTQSKYTAPNGCLVIFRDVLTLCEDIKTYRSVGALHTYKEKILSEQIGADTLEQLV